MKKLTITIIYIAGAFTNLFGQDSTFIKLNNWLTTKNFSIRKTFDGSKNENKPAGLSFQEDHKSNNDFLNIDVGIKLSEISLLKDSHLIFYPKIEWHKSTDSSDLKDKLDGGINFEFIPFGLKIADSSNKSSKGLILAPYFQGVSSFKQNFINNAFETKLTLQLSLSSNYKWLPGCSIRDSNGKFRARYYPYFGLEHNKLPNLIKKDMTEEFTSYFIRFFAEIWILPQTLQINIDGTYREIIQNNTSIKTILPIISGSLYFYPGRQESLGVGYEYKHGYDTDNKFQLTQLSSIKLSWKI